MLDYIQQLLNTSVQAQVVNPSAKAAPSTGGSGGTAGSQAQQGGTALAPIQLDFKSLASQITAQNGQSLPASKQMENFIALLHERLAQQLSVIYDDYARQDADLYLVQFDVGVYPSKHSKRKVAKVEFEVTAAAGESCTDNSNGIKAYELYPSAAAYNITQYYGKSNHTGVRGAVSYLAGMGGTIEYQRQRDQLRASINQSIYVTGFGAGTCRFGWYYAPNPFENMVSPGLRTSYLLLMVPKQGVNTGSVKSTPKISMAPSFGWMAQDDPLRGKLQAVRWNPVDLPATEPKGLQVAQIEYSPVRLSENAQTLPVVRIAESSTSKSPTVPTAVSSSGSPKKLADAGGASSSAHQPSDAKTSNPQITSKETPEASTSANPSLPDSASNSVPSNKSPEGSGESLSGKPSSDPETSSLQITFREVTDPNLIVIANGTLIKRVRDTRGRGTFLVPVTAPASDSPGADVSASFGLLESDTYGPDTWIAIGPRAIQINLSRVTATSDAFPVIILTNAGDAGNSLSTMAADADEIRIGDQFFDLKSQRHPKKEHGRLPQSMFLPMFLGPTPSTKILAFLENTHQI